MNLSSSEFKAKNETIAKLKMNWVNSRSRM